MATAANDFETVAGTKLYIAVAAPATYDATGYGALVWVQVGQITKVPSVLGRDYNTGTAETVDNPLIREKKGNYKLPPADFECLWADVDAGQILIAAAANDNSVPSFKVVKQGGGIRFFPAQVKNFIENLGTSNDTVKGAFTLLRQRDTINA